MALCLLVEQHNKLECLWEHLSLVVCLLVSNLISWSVLLEHLRLALCLLVEQHNKLEHLFEHISLAICVLVEQ